MSEEHSEFYKKMQNLILKLFAAFLLSFFGIAIPFYFNSKNTNENQNLAIKELKDEKADRDLYEVYIEQINKDIGEIKEKVDEL